MRQIELKRLVSEDKTTIVDYKEMIIQVARNHPRGISVDDMVDAVRILARVKVANGVLKLEDADWRVLVTYIKSYPFVLANETVIQFAKDIENASEIEV